MPGLFALTTFVSATLLFLVQPMIARMILPKVGGAPAVWNTCMVFFQAALLLGYGYAHLATRCLGTRGQAALHVLLLALSILLLPVAVSADWAPPGDSSPIPAVFGLLLSTVGIPFFFVSSTAPLVQKWFAGTSHRQAHDPYFLYAVSNLGNMLALVGYPLLMEPNFSLKVQGQAWAVGYVVLVLLCAACTFVVWRSIPNRGISAISATESGPQAGAVSSRDRLWWIALSFVPSSLMLGVTTHLSTNLTSIPLLWVVPLGLYLLSFILAFGRLPASAHRGMTWALPVGIALLVGTTLVSFPGHLKWLHHVIHLVVFFIAAVVGHGELAKRRPAVAHLTEFYFWVSLGGVLGGIFNALVAPLVFSTVAEYPLAIVLAALLIPQGKQIVERALDRPLDFGLPVALGIGAFGLISLGPEVPMEVRIGIPAAVSLAAWKRPLRFGLCIGALFLAQASYQDPKVEAVLCRERSFFGTLLVQRDRFKMHTMIHGTTFHGMQRRGAEDVNIRRLPLSYYDPTGPIGQLFLARLNAGVVTPVGTIGLGAGSLATYGEVGQEFNFFEIDPTVERVARDPVCFTFLSEGRANYRVVLGDGRLSMTREPDKHYGLIVVDAFSSDAIPTHLITAEAIDLYLQKLAPGGMLAFHISNNYLDLEPVLGDLAHAKRLIAISQNEGPPTSDERARGKMASHWVVLARSPADLKLLATGKWQRARRSETRIWTDDYSNVLSVILW